VSFLRYLIPTSGGIDIAGTLVPFRDSVKLLGVTLDSALSMDQHVTEVVRSCNYHIRALPRIRLYWRPMRPRCWHTALSHLGWTRPMHCWVARHPATSTDCKWHWIHLPELYIRHRVSPAPPNYDGSSTGCLFDSGSLTSWQSSPTAHNQLAHQSTWRTSSKTTTRLALCDQLINCYCLYHGWQ